MGWNYASNPFPALPKEFHGQYLQLLFHFYYNPDKRGSEQAEVPAGRSKEFSRVLAGGSPDFSLKELTTRITISPTDTRVVSGTTQQFSVTIFTTKGAVKDWKTFTTRTPANWTVFGTGCEGAACGTISDAGLYTAPATVPTPPTVTVRAALSTDSSKTASAAVEIVSESH